ncbi:unnamed protein product [Auanema sp. JU1783]|nr:unnamed protein product [Auanema sp. JU1783]
MTPTSTLTYQQWSRRRLLMSFVLFFAGWKAFGYALNDMLLWTVDEETGAGRFLTPTEGKAQREKMERERDAQFLPARAPKKFDFDD